MIAVAVLGGVLALFVVGLVGAVSIRRRRESERLAFQAETTLEGLLIAEQEKMNRMVDLVSGIAHRIGNPLTTLSINLDSLEASSKTLPPAQFDRRIRDMRDALSRMGGYLHDVRAFAGQHGDDTAQVDINELIRGLSGLVQLDDRTRRVTVSLDLSPHIGPLRLPRQRLSLALFIVLGVAAEGLRGDSGRIEIATRELPEEGGVKVLIATSETIGFGNLEVADPPALKTAERLIAMLGGEMAVRYRWPATKEFELFLPAEPDIP